MAIKAQDSITVIDYTDVKNVKAWYLLVPRTSSAPTVSPTATETQMTNNGWTTTEPGVDTTKKLYKVDQCIFGDNTYVWGDVSLSSSYEAAIQAYNEAQTAKTTATNYVTDISNGVMVHPSTDSTTGWKIADVIEMLKNGVSYIWAGLVNNIATIRIGKESGGHSVIDENGMRVYGDSTGATQLANIGYGEGSGESGTATTAPYYTFGTRASGSTIGNYSVAEGRNVQATGYCSHASGLGTVAGGGQFAIGSYNKAGNALFAIGNGQSDSSRRNIFEVHDEGETRGITEAPNTSVYVTKSTGTLISSRVNRFGMVVQLTLNFRNTSSTASGSDIFTGTLNKWRPTDMVTGATYFGGNALIGRISTAGNVTIRNASQSAVTISSSNSATISFTYITDDWTTYGE